MQKMTLFFRITFLLFVFQACSKDNGTGGDNSGGNNNTGNPGPLFTAVKGVMQSSCAVSSCHAAPNPQSGINLNDNATIVSQRTRIKVRSVDDANTSNRMPQPPRPPLSAADQKKITDWISAGGRITD